ncbi:cyclin-dependent kinase 1-like [Sitodiplosis mosellana]|uniref:cyclin-dependent kinase 1-like n=1 Tax=Sitodiplosis mosellana TaxID=263140 RepID=UPI0024452DD8|nr:cyclin-dependent kinase 1-like [Sitodiplosis mosellana]
MAKEYIKLEKLGSGSYGTVYKGREKDSNAIVAMKKVHMDLMDAGLPQSYLREISALQSLRHENIVQYEGIVWESNDHIYLIFEYMTTDLRSYMDEFAPYGLKLAAVRSYLYQTVKGLEACHKQGILHRDLKTENVLINKNGVVKIADFGLSRAISVPVGLRYSTCVVTLWYRAPEILLGQKGYSTPIDIWSLGCIFAEMISGHELFTGDSEIDQINKIFCILGEPTEEIWPHVTSLPYFRKFSDLEVPCLEKKILLRGPGFDLLKMMLTYNPNKRISAKRILNHQYFKDSIKMYPLLPYSK